METRKIPIILIILLISLLFMPVVSAASDIATSYSFGSNPVRQDTDSWVDVTIKNNDPNRVKITWVGIHFDWQNTGVYYEEDLIINPEYLYTGESTTIRIDFPVGQEISISTHGWNLKVEGYEDTIFGWTYGEVIYSTIYNFEVLERDRDGDNVGDSDDAFPDNILEWSDSDGDGVGNNSDVFPTDSTEWKDSDGDGVGDNSDAFPSDPSETKDTDNDGVGDNSDIFLNDPSESKDTDSDGVGDNADAFPNDSTETIDSDGDGVGNNGDAFPTDPSEWRDTDGDGIGDNSDEYPSDPTNTPPTSSSSDSTTSSDYSSESGDSSSSFIEGIDWNMIFPIFLILIVIVLAIVGSISTNNKKKSSSVTPSTPPPKKPVLLQKAKKLAPRISIKDLDSSINVIFPSHVEEGATTEVIITLANKTKSNISDVKADFSGMEDMFEIDGSIKMKLLTPGMVMKKTIRIKPKHEEGMFPVNIKISGSGATIEKQYTIKVGGTEIY